MRKLSPFKPFCFFVIALKAFAQPGDVFNITRLSKQDTLLSGWKFQAGDNPQWAGVGYDDTQWQPIDPGKDVEDFSKLTNGGIGWIRLHIAVDTLANQQFMAWVSQYSASEIYLNGKLILKYGTVSTDPAKVIAYLPSREPFYIKLIPGKDNLVAVRLAYQPGLPYLSISYTPLPAFSIRINNYQAALTNYRDYIQSLTLFIIFYTLSGGMLLIICIIHLVYFLVDRSQKVNLYYCLLNLLLCINPLPNEIWGIQRFGNISSQLWISVIQEFVNFIPGMLFLLMTIYTLFNYPNRLVFKILVFIGIVSAASIYFMGTVGFVISIVGFPIICFFEEAYVCIWAIKRQKKDAAIILTGLFLFIIFTVLGSSIDQSKISTQIAFEISLLSFPIGMSFYLGVQSSLTNKQLRSMLVEVQTLSAQNLAQEVEKQQLLASQNETLEQQVTERTAELNQSLTELRSTQTHLIQSEKMASLGELTAGIAHEIQNPLNFVNNFSEVNTELIIELEQEVDKGDLEEIKAIALDIKENEKKINLHGKRADAIVKGMLQHSKASSGIKELIDLNVLAEEFLKLSSHGLRAKDKSFNAEIVTHFDPDLPKINAVQQDIGKVFLNLFNNAFYALNKKHKTAGTDYKPTVEVGTSDNNGSIWISVKDNGTGIPDAVKDKIMQPFFTTKPTGEGTGLGLSLTYDMVVKGHGGKIDVNTKEGEFTEFVVSLPSS